MEGESLLSRDPQVPAAYDADPLCYHGAVQAAGANQTLEAATDARCDSSPATPLTPRARRELPCGRPAATTDARPPPPGKSHPHAAPPGARWGKRGPGAHLPGAHQRAHHQPPAG